MQNLSYGNDFDLEDNVRARKIHFLMKGCAPRLVLKQRYKWPIDQGGSVSENFDTA